ncbi:MAG: hypothetical protein LBG52_05165 [Candidatus Peribacteria bacterium]|nr:hypothetical protein [Candidatus Peribacteria bacterium]
MVTSNQDKIDFVDELPSHMEVDKDKLYFLKAATGKVSPESPRDIDNWLGDPWTLLEKLAA